MPNNSKEKLLSPVTDAETKSMQTAPPVPSVAAPIASNPAQNKLDFTEGLKAGSPEWNMGVNMNLYMQASEERFGQIAQGMQKQNEILMAIAQAAQAQMAQAQQMQQAPPPPGSPMMQPGQPLPTLGPQPAGYPGTGGMDALSTIANTLLKGDQPAAAPTVQDQFMALMFRSFESQMSNNNALTQAIISRLGNGAADQLAKTVMATPAAAPPA
jgi:hypothetical protein